MEFIDELKDNIRQAYFRFRRPDSLAAVLKQFVPPSIVDAYSEKVAPGSLIERLAKDYSLERDEFLTQVASRLGIGVVSEPNIPTEELITLAGISEVMLRQCGAIPQQSLMSRAGYALAVSDPFLIDLQEYRAQGIPVLLSAQAEVADLWEKYDVAKKAPKQQIAESQVFAALKQLAQDAHQLGSFEVFVGHPVEEGYEFLANNKLYSGRLHPMMYPALLSYFQDSFRLEKKVESAMIKSLSLSLTRSFERPVVCLTWEVQAPAVSPAPVIMQTEKPLTQVPVQENIKSAEHRHVLLVDDDDRFLLILGRILENKGWIVDQQLNGEAALHVLEQGDVSPELIISDVHMPSMDGATFLKRLRELQIETPVVMLTSDDDHLLEAELALLGADAFVRKQEDPRILLAWCNSLLSRGSRLAKDEEKPAVAINGAYRGEHAALRLK